jgi:hypothetical protein
LEAQQHKKYAQTTPLDDEVSSLFSIHIIMYTSWIGESSSISNLESSSSSSSAEMSVFCWLFREQNKNNK